MDNQSDPFVDAQLQSYDDTILSLGALFDNDSPVKPDHPGIMRVKRIRALLRAQPALKSDPLHQRLLRRLQNRAITAYRQQREHPAAWAAYAARLVEEHTRVKWANPLAPADRATITAAMEAVPSPLDREFTPPAPPPSAWQQLCAMADREIVHSRAGRGTTWLERTAITAENLTNRETSRARAHRDALALALIGNELPASAFTAMADGLSWPERVAYDVQVCQRLGRGVPRAEGHTLAHVPLHERPEP